MSYSFNQSFQEWAETHSVPCSCRLEARPEDHKADCPVAAAYLRWQEEGRKLYATFPAPQPQTLS